MKRCIWKHKEASGLDELISLESSQSPATTTEVHRTQAPLGEWYHGPMLSLENYNQTTHVLYPGAFTFARWKELPGNFPTLVVVRAPDLPLSTRQGQQQEVLPPPRQPVPCHLSGKHLGSYRRPTVLLLVLYPMGSDTDPMVKLI